MTCHACKNGVVTSQTGCYICPECFGNNHPGVAERNIGALVIVSEMGEPKIGSLEDIENDMAAVKIGINDVVSIPCINVMLLPFQ